MTAGRSRPIAWRITALCLAVAGVVAVVGGVISTRLVVSTAREVTQQTLADQADVVAAQLADLSGGIRRMVDILEGQQIEIVLRRPNGNIVGGTDGAKRAALDAGLATTAGVRHHTVEQDGRMLLVELRPVADRSAVALVRDAGTARGIGRKLVGNIAVALGIGLLVAAAAGLVLARLMARPLTRTAAVATAMGHGRRDLRVPVEGPREVADVAASVNGLADALATSEGRQREFLLSVSHELRTPLTAVKGFAESLADGVVSGAEAVRAGRTIEAEAARLDRLVGDLLDLARLGADDFRLDIVGVDLAAVVADAATVWAARCAEAGVEFVLDMPPGPVRLRTDPRRVRQVIDGLAENALRVTPRGRPIVLALRAGDWAVIQVRDGGPGLTGDDYDVAFEPKVLNNRYAGTRPGGTGIGLALVRGLAARLGGTITAGPAPEGGAAFSLRLPVA